jgi:uncharacterized protein (DUF58 family)
MGAGFTTRAGCLLAAGVAAVLCGLVLGEYDLVRGGLIAVAIPLVASVIVRRSRVSIASQRDPGPIRVPAGEPVSVGLSVTNRALLPTGSLMLEDQLPPRTEGRARFVISTLGSRESRAASYRLPGLGRGRYVMGPLRLRLTEPFGLIDISRSFRSTTTAIVHPVVDELPPMTLPRSWDAGDNQSSHSIGSHGADDASIREYRQGDDLRKVHWRSSAKTGVMMVRHEERPWQGHTCVLVDTRGAAHSASTPAASDARETSSLEWAVSFAASVTNHLLRAGRETTLVAGTTLIRPSGHHDTVVDDELAMLQPSSDRDLLKTVDAARAAGRDSAIVAVLGALDVTSIHAVSDLRPRGSRSAAYAVVLDTATWLRHRPDRGAYLPTADAVAALRAAGWWVAVARQGDPTPTTWARLLEQSASHALGDARS